MKHASRDGGRPTSQAYPALKLGPLPIDRINATIGTALAAGMVTLSKAAHRHIATSHPVEYPLMMAALGGIIANPAFIGRDPAHPHAFYLIDAMDSPVGAFGLVAIGFTLTAHGTYAVASAYGLKVRQLTARVKEGRVQRLL